MTRISRIVLKLMYFVYQYTSERKTNMTIVMVYQQPQDVVSSPSPLMLNYLAISIGILFLE